MAFAAGGPAHGNSYVSDSGSAAPRHRQLLGIDHRVTYDDSGIWRRKTQLHVIDAVLLAEFAGALWEGGESRVGKTFWQSVDASVFAGGTAFVLKRVFERTRPSATADPGMWFQGCCQGRHQSFPSGEVSAITASVTPFVLEYGPDNPWVYALEILPAYDMAARVKTWGHWQTDVLAGYAIGFLAGWYAHERKFPLVLGVMPHGIYVGLKMEF
ncbi:MAG TPA: phosphatase PAP2 family protein [Gammaproteobacteria bacterium]|nr:phosphatase PAP2 family protein [Gammaproteobacteria bacterium]